MISDVKLLKDNSCILFKHPPCGVAYYWLEELCYSSVRSKKHQILIWCIFLQLQNKPFLLQKSLTNFQKCAQIKCFLALSIHESCSFLVMLLLRLAWYLHVNTHGLLLSSSFDCHSSTIAVSPAFGQLLLNKA